MFSHLQKLSYKDRLQALGLWSLEERRNRPDVIEVFKMAKGLSSTPLETLFDRDSDSKTRGHTFKLKKILVNVTQGTTISQSRLSQDGMH